MFTKFITRLAFLFLLIDSSFAKTVGIIQIIEHPALDATRQGIIDRLKKTDPTLKIVWRSAQGTLATSVQLAQKFVGQKVDAIVALGTTSAQAATKVAQGTTIPVVFASVTDPKSAGLVGLAAGVSNFVDVDQQLSSIQRILPNLTRLGIIYSPGEANSEKLIKLTQEYCKNKGIELVCSVAMKPMDVMMATKKLAGTVDAIFINNDNTALAAFPTIVKIADETRTPVFASDADLIKSGAVSVLGPDQYEIGVQTADVLTEILKTALGSRVLLVEYPKSVDLYFNKDKAAALGLSIDPSLTYKDLS